MDIKHIRQLLREGSQVVLVQDGEPPLIVREFKPDPVPEEVPIISRSTAAAAVSWRPKLQPEPPRQDQILERLNREILALKAQIEQEEAGV